ncbi:MAG: DMT family transporter [Erysipelotrichaceae bacterium]|nr:DMT family transporter [Erysipelotrichaceae bacterium]
MKKLAPWMVLLAAVLWGSNGIFINLLTDSGFSAIERTSARMVLAVFMEAVILFLTDKKSFRIDGKGLLWSALIGVLGMYLFLVLYTAAIARVGMGTAGVLIYLMPSLVMAYSCLFKGEKFTLIKGIALCLNLLGCALVSGIMNGAGSEVTGILCGIAAAFFYAFNNIAVAHGLKDYAPATKMFYPALFAGLSALVYLCVFSDIGSIASRLSADPKLIFFIALWALCCSIFTYYLFNTALSYLNIVTASMLSTFEPVAAVLFGVLLFNERQGLFGWIGVILVIASLILIEYKPEGGKSE